MLLAVVVERGGYHGDRHVAAGGQLRRRADGGRVDLAMGEPLGVINGAAGQLLPQIVRKCVLPPKVQPSAAPPLQLGRFRPTADDRDGLPRFQRQHTFVFKQHHAFLCQRAAQLVVLLHVRRCACRLSGVGQRAQAPHRSQEDVRVELVLFHGSRHLLGGSVGLPRHLQVAARPQRLHPVVHRAPVGYHQAVKAPFLPQHAVEHRLVFAAIFATKPVIRSHDAQRASFLDGDFKPAQVNLPQGLFLYVGIDGLPVEFRVVS